MYCTNKTYVAHDIDLFFTKFEILEITQPLFENEADAKKSFFNLIISLKSFFNDMEHVTIEFPNPPSSGKALFKLKVLNDDTFNYLLKVCEQIQSEDFLKYFSELEQNIRTTVFDKQVSKNMIDKNLKSYFLYQSLNESLGDNKPKMKSNKI